MKTGRRAKPSAQKALAGNPGKRPLNKNEPKPPSVVVDVTPPAPLGKIAQKEWDRLAPRLATMKILTDLDLQLLVNYCLAVQQRDEAEAELAILRQKMTRAALVMLTPNKMQQQHALLGVRNSAMRDIASFGSLLGLDPSSRSRLEVADAAEDDDWGEYDTPSKRP